MTLRLAWLGHSTVVLDLGPVRLLTDPLLGRHAGVLRRRGPAPRAEAWAGPSAVLLSHLHHDHAEVRSLRRAGAPVLTGAANVPFLARHGLVGVGLDERGWHTLPGTDVQVHLTRADHGHRPMPHRPNAAHGHLVRTPEVTVWVAGDTSLYAGMEALPDLAGGVDVAVVPIGGWGPRLSAGHLDPVQAARAAHLVGAQVVVPYHFGTLHAPGTAGGWMAAPGPAFVDALRSPGHRGGRTRGVLLDPGGSVTL